MLDLVESLLADKAVSWFKGKGTSKSTNSDEKSGWVTKAVMFIVVLAFVAYLAYGANRRAKELAKVKHERDVSKEDLHRAQVDWELSDIDADIEESMENLHTAIQHSLTLDAELESIEEEHEFEQAKIGAIENWDDMDRYLDGLRAK